MAIEFLRMKSTHGNNAKLNDYISRENQYSKKEDIIAKGSGNLPSWAQNSHDFWLACDQYQNSQKPKENEPKKDLKIKDETGKHIIVALPKEFNNEELTELGQKIAEKIAGNDHAYTYGIHVNTGVLSDEKNPHLHLFLSNRKIEPERDEPTRETYFKKSRTLKTGEITGGYRKDIDMTGTHRTEWLKQKKNEFQELTNQAIQEHNRRTGEKVSKIDFKAREGKGSKHIGMTDIAYAVRYNAPVKKIQKELDRRIRNATEEENRKIAKSEKELIKKSTKLTIMDKITVAVAPLIENPFNAAKRAVKRENIRMAMHREKLTPLQKEKLAKIHEKNVQKAEDLILEKQDKFNAGLKREAEKRGKNRTFEYTSHEKAAVLARIRHKKEQERLEYAEKQGNQEIIHLDLTREGRHIFEEYHGPITAKQWLFLDESARKEREAGEMENWNLLRKISAERANFCDKEGIKEVTWKEQQAKIIEERRKEEEERKANQKQQQPVAKVKKKERDRGFSR